jgi:ABC-type sugar transport system substrate-binding protein
MTRKHPRLSRGVTAGAFIALAATGLAGPSLAARVHAQSRTAAPPGQAAAKALVANAQRVPPFKGPRLRINARSLKGKTVWIIVNSLQNPFNTQLAKAAQTAFGKVGIKTKLIDGKGQTTEWTRDIQLAAAQKPAAVLGSGLSTQFLKGALKDLASAKVPFVDDLLDVTVPEPAGVSAKVGVDTTHAGSVNAAYAIANMGSSSDGVLVLNDSEFSTSVGIYANAAKGYLNKNCPACQVVVKDELFASAATNIPADVQNIIRANPGIKWIVAGYDYQAGLAVQGLQQAGITDVKVVASGGNAPQLNQVRSGDSPYVADQLISGVWAGWVGADLSMRLMLHVPVKAETAPFRLLTHSNIPATNNPIKLTGTNFQTPFLKLWKVK